MHTLQRLQQFSTEELKKRLSLHRFALGAVWLGAGFAFGIGLARMDNTNPEVLQMMLVSGLALLASIPVYRQKRRISTVLSEKS